MMTTKLKKMPKSPNVSKDIENNFRCQYLNKLNSVTAVEIVRRMSKTIIDISHGNSKADRFYIYNKKGNMYD